MKRNKVCFLVFFVTVSVLGMLLFIEQQHSPAVILTAKKVRRDSGVVKCSPGKPCEYPDEVDLRIIVMTFNRGASLLTLLKSLDKLVLDGDNASLEIWIDRDKSGKIDDNTVRVAEGFKWKQHGQIRVNIQQQHVGIYGQWIDTWRPKPGSKEVALFLEDDLSVSPYAWRWLKAVHGRYSTDPSCSGYTLTSEGVKNAVKFIPLTTPMDQVVFMYRQFGSWGFLPNPEFWVGFQDWFHSVDQETFNPYVDGIVHTEWYKSFQKSHTADSMWAMWFLYYTNMKQAYCVYNNLKTVRTTTGFALCIHREEKGLHFFGQPRKNVDKFLLSSWSKEFVKFPKNITRLAFNGKVVK